MAAILSRCLVEFDNHDTAFVRYAAIRIPRVGDVHRISIENTWMHGPTETDWFFAYNAFNASLHA